MIREPSRRMHAPRCGAVLLLLLTAGFGCVGGGLARLPETASVASRVVLISISGVTAARLDPDVMPTLSALAEAGAVARRVDPIAPASERPALATLVTGVPPSLHGIVSERRLGDRGVRRAGYDHASLLRAEPLWQSAGEVGLAVASLDWPTTLGAEIPLLLPDLGEPGARERDASWAARLAGETTPQMLERVRARGGDRAETGRAGAARDAVIRSVACDLLEAEAPPKLLLLRLRGTAPVLATYGPYSAPARDAFRAADRELWELLLCLEGSGLLEETAVVVTGAHGYAEVHTAVAPNAVLAGDGLIQLAAGGVGGWDAIARSNGGSAFVYARGERAALRARAALSVAAERSGAFRVVTAEEMIRSGADPEAWFGLEAAAGFAFRDDVDGPLLAPSPDRSVGGYLPERPEMEPALVAWGAGVRRGIRIPQMRQTDVAPTFARLLGIALEPGDQGGRALVGVLTPESLRVSASEPR